MYKLQMGLRRKALLQALQIVELQVNMDCGGCERKIRKALSQLQGVDNVEIDMSKQKVTVTGYIDRKKVIKAVRGCGKKAEVWPYPYDVQFTSYTERYYERQTFVSTYNYRKHGYNGSSHGYYQSPPYSTVVDDNLTDLFSDENPHSCRIM
ncbi:heavy metal-associated isoprenylated plant protein 29-like [Cryptomeria japonica]|uniref:heavy metal-associated isoprenylated plant protein 29-like n=1 Tax=Cryptomeria japonica TaxID=3369 RepID=UPI0025ABC694|nr:heavy metal-associated isoprenylated plant protein 29-like [Cryptomeria japonica]